MPDVLPEDMTELYDAEVPRVDLVGKGANGVPSFLLMKGEGSRGLLAPNLIRDLIAKSEDDPPEGQLTVSGSPAAIAALIHDAAVRKAAAVDTDVAKAEDMEDDLDPTVILAEADGDAPGLETAPGSPAWEAVDAATARKWTSILARAKAAVEMLADREMLEAAGSDPSSADNAWDLQDACCAIDYAISVLAPFAVAEQAEADLVDDMQMVGKALAGFDTAPLEAIEALGPIRKAGRVLSSANEAAIRGAVEQLQKVLASLPAAPAIEHGDHAVAKTANEEPAMPEPTPATNITAASGQEPAMGAAETAPKPEAGVPVTDVTKADGQKTPMVVVYDQKGKLVGIVDPADITPVANSEADPEDMDGADDTAEAEPAAEDSDLTPQPAGDAGTPAATVDDSVAKTDADTLKSLAHAEAEAALAAYKTAQIADHDALVKQVEELKALVKQLGEQPAPPKVFANGVTPPRDVRGMDRVDGAAPVDVTKAMEMRAAFRSADPAEQNRIATQMQEAAIGQLAALHGRG